MFASVVVSTYNRRKILQRTIQSLLNQSLTNDKYEIIVVDDCSVDDTAEYMNGISKSGTGIIYVRHIQNEGRVVTRNDGIKVARGEIIIFIDDDNVPDENFIQEHLKCYEQNKGEKIAVMGNASYAPEVIGNSNFAKFMQSRYLGNRSESSRSTLDYNDLPARCLGTLNCSVKRLDLLEVGMFDNSFRYYGGEDEYLGQCLKKKGIRLVFADKARTLHYDILSLTRYKQKTMEAAKFGLNILINKSPEYLENTKIKHLIPISLKNDKFIRILIKSTIRIVLNRYTIYLLERWATYIDHISFLYYSYIYRALIAGWIISGQKLKLNNNVFVSYDIDSNNSRDI